MLSNRPCLLSVFAVDNTAAQRFDSTKFSERTPFRKFGAISEAWFDSINFFAGCPFRTCGAIEPPFAAVLPISNTDNNQGRFDSTKYSEECRFRKFGAIEPLRFPTMRTAKGGSVAPSFQKGLLSNNVVLSNRCAAVSFNYPLQMLTTNRGGSTAPIFLKGSPSENLVLSTRCVLRQ